MKIVNPEATDAITAFTCCIRGAKRRGVINGFMEVWCRRYHVQLSLPVGSGKVLYTSLQSIVPVVARKGQIVEGFVGSLNRKG